MRAMIKHTNQLNKQQIEELQQLAQQCKVSDGDTPNLYVHILSQERAFPASLLYYEQEQLVGFLSIYFFYEHAVELSILVAPKYRQQGIAKKLMQTIMPLLQQQQYATLICSAPAHHHALLAHCGCVYLHSEYYMARHELAPLLNYSMPKVSFRQAQIEDSSSLHQLDELCFPKKNGAFVEHVSFFLGKREYKILAAFYDNQLIGKAHIRWQEDSATLSDIAIVPSLQGRGFGGALISQCINVVLDAGKSALYLDVETHNKTALNLYSRLGFVVENACDFWSITTAKLLEKIRQ